MWKPDLVFNQAHCFPSVGNRFWELAKMTLERYEDLKLNIRSFRLLMFDDGVSLAKELIVKSIKLGVVDLTIQIFIEPKDFVLPDEVLQSKTLARLYLKDAGGGSITVNLSPLWRGKKEIVNMEEFQQLRSLPWETFYQVSSDKDGYDVRFQLN